MSNITADLVKKLREISGAGMMDCKKALTEVKGDIDDAVDWLRKKGLSVAAKKSGRVAAEGLVSVITGDKQGAIVEVNSETDFVSRNENFQALVCNITKIALESDAENNEALLKCSYPGGGNMENAIKQSIGTIGENMTLRRFQKLSVNQGAVSAYVHSAIAPNLGRIGVLVALESSASVEQLQDLGKKIAMHIAAANPIALHTQEVDQATIDREKAVVVDQAKASGRPENVIEKMVEGRMRKFFEEVVLLEQAFIMDGKTKVADIVANKAKELGAEITLKAFVKYSLGEGIEKQETDFAAEVRAQAGV